MKYQIVVFSVLVPNLKLWFVADENRMLVHLHICRMMVNNLRNLILLTEIHFQVLERREGASFRKIIFQLNNLSSIRMAPQKIQHSVNSANIYLQIRTF